MLLSLGAGYVLVSLLFVESTKNICLSYQIHYFNASFFISQITYVHILYFRHQHFDNFSLRVSFLLSIQVPQSFIDIRSIIEGITFFGNTFFHVSHILCIINNLLKELKELSSNHEIIKLRKCQKVFSTIRQLATFVNLEF